MASKNWQARGRILASVPVLACLATTSRAALAAPAEFAPPSYIGSIDPHFLWEIRIGGVVGVSFLAAITLWMTSALRKVRRAQLRRNAFVSSALNNLSQGVVMTDAR